MKLVQKAQEYWQVACVLSPRPFAARLWFALFLLLIPLRKKIFGRKPVPIRLQTGRITTTFFVRDAADIATLKEIFVDREYAVALSFVPKNIADIGGHIGSATLFFLSRYPDAHITAYEPDPDNFDLLVKNLHHFPNVSCVHAAVSSVSGEVPFFKNSSSISSSLVEREGVHDKISVTAVSLDDILAGDTDLIKFDIEGAEYAFFAATTGVERCKAFVGEVHYDLIKKTNEEFLSLFPRVFAYEERTVSPCRSIVYLHQ